MSEPNLRPLFDFIEASPSPYHGAERAGELLAAAGHAPVDPTAGWAGTGPQVMVRGGTLVATTAASGADGIDPARLAFRIVGAHTDSPNLRIRPRPDTGAVGYRQLAVEPYGGVLLNSWLDRDLGVSGRVVVRGGDGTTTTHLVKVDRPLLRVPQLAIHLDRDVNRGLVLDPQQHLTPAWGLGSTGEGDFAAFLAAELDADPADVVAWEMMTHDLTPPTLLGRDDEFYAAGRIDNLASCFAATEAMASLGGSGTGSDAAAGAAHTVAVVVLFDHEEVGSASATGAAGPLLAHCLESVALAAGADRAQFLAALARSCCVSADGAHAVHPNYPERHEPGHLVELNGGPAVKLNSGQRYATDANTSAVFQQACRDAGVEFQLYSHRADLPCGSTIGPATAAGLGVDVVDVGSPQLSMHSARELGGSADPPMLTAALRQFLLG
ncbi:MAG TPA: M18 family aminopeptidase [Acidimicrobiaceae bacterium]|nr:M18 family aminopeptidase [Acidimicrobiaceae bacterium]